MMYEAIRYSGQYRNYRRWPRCERRYGRACCRPRCSLLLVLLASLMTGGGRYRIPAGRRNLHHLKIMMGLNLQYLMQMVVQN
uniref:Uncharacterized protein n=1 Tax=Timema bartmani TaxID=61472 RepID=A0A7R9I058_9NEOP|nr:unnamed protein product [Timema bartmani]